MMNNNWRVMLVASCESFQAVLLVKVSRFGDESMLVGENCNTRVLEMKFRVI